MIAMVQVEKWKRMRFREKLAFRFRRYALEKEEIQSPWGSYLLLHVCDRKIRWDQLEQAAEQEQLLVILPKGLTPPEEFPFFSAVALDESFFRSAVGRLLSQLPCPMSGRQILLADLKGVRLEWLKEWLFYSPVFHVACPNEDLRQALAQQLLEEYGVVLLHDKVIPQHGRGILLDPAGWLRPWKGFQGLVLTAKRMPGKGICLEPASEALGEWRLPEGILAQDFLASILQENRLSPTEMPCQGWQNGILLSWKELLQQAAESCLDR